MSGGGGPAEETGPRSNVFGEALPQSVELNLTALMDILSNLLFFLLASFGATIVMSINATVPVQSADSSDVADQSLQVTVNVSLSRDHLELSAAGSKQTEEELARWKKTIAHVGGKPDYAALAAHLGAIKQAYPKSDTILLTPEAGLPYAQMIGVMDAAREIPDPNGPAGSRLKLFPTVVVSSVVK